MAFGRLRAAVLAIGCLIVGGIAYIPAEEFYIYSTRSEAKAEAKATTSFKSICAQYGIDAEPFHGPKQIGRGDNQYIFAWERAPGEAISVAIMYAPFSND